MAEILAIAAVATGLLAMAAPSVANSARHAPGGLVFDKTGQAQLKNVGATGTPIIVARASGDILLKVPRRAGRPPCFAVARRTSAAHLSISSAVCLKSSHRLVDVSGFESRQTPDGWSTKILNLTGFTDGSIRRIGIVAKGRFTRWYAVKNRVYDVRFSTPLPVDSLVALDASGTTVWSEQVNRTGNG